MDGLESLETMWRDLGIDASLVIDAGASIDAKAWATMAGIEAVADPSIEVDELPGPAMQGRVDAEDIVLGDEIGRGSMGVVCTATQTSIDRQVAVKTLLPSASQAAVGALINEARVTGRLEHPNIPPVHVLCQRDGLPMLVMKRIRGAPWQALIDDPEHLAWQRTPWADEPAAYRHAGVAERLCDALHYAHSHGVVHRDIKPANVMIGAFGEVYLLDWGMAANLEDVVEPGGPVVGTPAYMCAEMVDGRAEARSDVYLVGASLYCALQGRPLHHGATLFECLAQVYANQPVVLDEAVPDELAAIVRCAVAHEPEDRYDSVVELQRALRDARARRGSRSLVDASLARLAQAHGVDDPAEAGVLLAEARFGLRQVLATWDDAAARDGLQRVHVALAGWELSQGNLVGAERYLEQLEAVPDDLRARVEALRDQRAHQQQLHARAQELDPEVASTVRTRYLAVLAALMVGLAMVVAWSARSGGGLGYGVAIWGSGNAALLTLGSMVWWRERLFQNLYNRQIMLMVVLASCGIFLSRILMMQLAVPLPHALVADLVLLSGLAGAAGIMIRTWMLALSALAAGAAILSVVLPGWIPVIVAGTAIAAALVAFSQRGVS